MKKLSVMLRECRIEKVLRELVAGLPTEKRAFMLQRYYSVYCMMLEEWRPSGDHDVILTGFKKVKKKPLEDSRSFYGIWDYRKKVSEEEYAINPVRVIKSGRVRVKVIDWAKIIRTGSDIEVLIPDCLAEFAGDTELEALILHRIELVCSRDIPKRSNKKMFAGITSSTPFLPGRMAVLEKTVSHRVSYDFQITSILDEIREYTETFGVTMQWEDLLGIERSDLNMGWEEGTWEREEDSDMKLTAQVFRCMAELDPDNPPSFERVREEIREMHEQFSNLGLSEFQEVQQKRKRIVIEPNSAVRTHPFIRVRSSDGKEAMVEDVELSELMCMDIHVVDKTFFSKQQVMALLLFNLLYPIRMKRMQMMKS